MKLHTTIFKVLAGILLGTAVLSSCTQEEEVFSTAGKTALAAPTVTAGEIGTSSISFSWNAVENAGQYYYKVVNPLGYTVAKGTTTETSVTVKGLKFSTEFKVYVNSVPDAKSSKKYCASEPVEISITTDSPIIINYDWVQDGVAYFYSDDQTWNKSNVTVGREKETGHFVVTSWCGVEGFDLYFDISGWDGSSWPIEFKYGTSLTFQPVVGQAIDQVGKIGDRGDLQLSHGLGGKTKDFIYWYGKGASYDFGELDPTGGYVDLWCKDYTDSWVGFRIEYGQYEPEPEPDPVPDADAEESWSQEAACTAGEENIGKVNISFDASTGVYTIPAWYGVEGYDLAFTRNETTGDWIIDTNCSAYAGENEDGEVGLYHGIGRAKNSICWIDGTAWSSGLSGNSDKGYVNANITAPDGSDVTYKVTWPNANYVWTMTGTYTCGKHESTVETTLSYNEEADNYMLVIPQYGNVNIIFETNADGAFLPIDGEGIYNSNDKWWWIDYVNEDGEDDYVYINVPASTVDIAGGTINLVTDYYGTDVFKFGGLPTIDSLVGTYTQHTAAYYRGANGWEWLDNYADGVEDDCTAEFGDVTIEKVDATTIKITGIADVTDGLIATVDEANYTISVAAGQAFDGCFIKNDLTGTYDVNCKITIDGWSAHNATDDKDYWDQCYCTLIKK